MMKPLTKKIAAYGALATLAFGSISFQARDARALSALLSVPSAGAGAVIAGAAMVSLSGVSLIGGGIAASVLGEDSELGYSMAVVAEGGAWGTFLGVFALDTPTGVKYAPVTPDQARRLAFTPDEFAAYNDSDKLDEINAVAESVAADVARSKQMSGDYARTRWEVYGAVLGNDALSAVQKVSASATKIFQLNAANKR